MRTRPHESPAARMAGLSELLEAYAESIIDLGR
jgi:hypothetical protein